MNIQHFGGRSDGNDTTLAVRRALEDARQTGEQRLIFPTGEYHFWPNRAQERYLFVSNNDESLKRLIFVLDAMEDFEIDGQGSLFVFHGSLSPFFLNGAKNIRLSNFSIEWARSFHSEAHVLGVEGNAVDLHIPEQFPYQVEYERLVFTGEGGDVYGIGNALEFDPMRRETAFQVTDNYTIRHWHRAQEIGPRAVRLEANWTTIPTPGNVLALMSGERFCPAVIISNSQQIELENVTLHHAGGMGTIAQCSRDLTLRDVRVTPRAGSGRLVSLTADATHFSCCEGKITLENCLFENQLDDAINIHGIYHQIVKQVSPREVEVRLVHPQQLGVDIVAAGDMIDFVENETLGVYFQGIVAGVERLNRSCFRLRFDADLPTEIAPNHAVFNHRWNPEVSITNCTARGNRARGFLLNSSGKMRVQNNTFHTPGAAILIAGDANYWFESGPVNDVTIADNLFDNCNFGLWGRAAIDIDPEIEPHRRARTVYHRNIRIENNTFRAFDPRLLRAHGVAGLVMKNNRLETTNDYPATAKNEEFFAVEGCPDADLESPIVASNGTAVFHFGEKEKVAV